MPHQQALLTEEGTVHFAPLDIAGYLEDIERMRYEFPELRIRTGVEFGQPHIFERVAAEWVDFSRFDRILGSLHTLDLGLGRAEPNTLFRENDASDVMEAYLTELALLATESDVIDVVAHIDYPVRHWPSAEIGPFDPRAFEDGFRAAMRTIAQTGRALEMNTRRLWPWIPQWWSEEGGTAVTFGSDAHTPDAVASGFPEAVAMLEHFGFRAGAAPEDFWVLPSPLQ
jgi:histidinol-phosphatase (PHP family)